MKKIIIVGMVGFFVALLTGCGTVENAVLLDPYTNYFPVHKDRQASVTVSKKVSINSDTLKSLLVVPSKDYWKKMGENLDYFDEVLTFSQFANVIIKKGLAGKISRLDDIQGLSRVYDLYKPFFILELTDVWKKGGGGLTTILTLYDPKSTDTIFESEIKPGIWGLSDQRTVFPLLNSLLDYLRE